MKQHLLSALFLCFFASTSIAQDSQTAKPSGQAGCPDCNQHADAAGVVAAPKELSAQVNCPVSGEALEDRNTFFDFEGQRIYTCCKKCLKKASSTPEKTVLAMYKDGVQLENVQTTCPVSGNKLENRNLFVQIYNKRIYVCSDTCKTKAGADPAKYLDVLQGRHPQVKCAVMGGKVRESSPFIVQGVLIKQCCPGCEPKFRADPATHFAKLAKNGAVVEQASTICMVMTDKPTLRTHFVTLGSRRYFFCCEPCVLSFIENPQSFIDAEIERLKSEASSKKK